MTFGFPVVLPNGSARDVVCVVVSSAVSGFDDFSEHLGRFSHTEVHGMARERFKSQPGNMLSHAQIFREGARVVGSDLNGVVNHSSFHGDSAHLALLLQTLCLAYRPRSLWLDESIVWATGAIAERGENARLLAVDPKIFEHKMQAFMQQNEPARAFLCPKENWKDLRPRRETPLELPLSRLLLLESFTATDRCTKYVIPCEETELRQLLHIIFPELPERQYLPVESRSSIQSRHITTTLGLALALVVVGAVSAYYSFRSSAPITSSAKPVACVALVPSASTDQAISTAPKYAGEAGATPQASRKAIRWLPRSSLSEVAIGMDGNAVPCAQIERSIQEAIARRDQDCNLTSAVLPSQAKRCNEQWRLQLDRLRKEGATCTHD